MNPRYGNGRMGVRVERSHPEEDQRRPNYPSPQEKLYPSEIRRAQRKAIEEADAARRKEAAKKFRDLANRLN